MQVSHRSVLMGALSLFVLAGCDFSSPWGSSSGGSQYGAVNSTGSGGTGTGTGTGGGTTSPKGGVGGESGTNGSDNTVLATPSVDNAVVAVGSAQTISITFTSSDGLSTTGFGISGSLGSVLPAGWSGPTTFTCALVATGSDCVLNLTYAPTAADSGTVVLNYVYVDNAGLSKAPGGSVTVTYQAIAANNVVATATPTGQITARVGSGSQSVGVNFTTDNGFAATNFALTTDLAALPAGWSSTAPSLTCAIVSTGNGCQLMLSYAPSAAARGTLNLSYSYVDNLGASRTGTLNVPYSNTSANTVNATASPAGQIIAIQKTGGQAVTVSFTTDDGNAASGLMVTSNLRSLPAGWRSAASSFTCGSVSTGNGCQLALTYAPTALASGTLVLNYAYTDDAGTAQTGTFDLPYAATTNDNVVATPSPSGQINAVVGMGSQAVTVVFTSDDGRSATAMALTSSLAALPAGWTSTESSLTCSEVTSGASCQLNLTYAPTAAGSGTLMLNYGYKNNDEQPKTGSISIPYRATTNDTVVGTPSASSIAVPTGGSSTVTVTFATDDGNPASALSVTSGLSPLPAGWSSVPSSLSCSTVSAGTVCQVALTYMPTAADSGTLSLGYTYTNDAGISKTGTTSIAYRATTNNLVTGASSPNPLAVASGSSNPVTVTFTTNDGNSASALTVTSGLSTLPGDWSGPATFTCSTVSSGTPCQLALTYAPTGAESGSVTFNFSYTNNAGTVKTGTVTINYSAS